MGRNKSNAKIHCWKDNETSNVYIDEGKNNIGLLQWNAKKKQWVFKNNQKKPKKKR